MGAAFPPDSHYSMNKNWSRLRCFPQFETRFCRTDKLSLSFPGRRWGRTDATNTFFRFSGWRSFINSRLRFNTVTCGCRRAFGCRARNPLISPPCLILGPLHIVRLEQGNPRRPQANRNREKLLPSRSLFLYPPPQTTRYDALTSAVRVSGSCTTAPPLLTTGHAIFPAMFRHARFTTANDYSDVEPAKQEFRPFLQAGSGHLSPIPGRSIRADIPRFATANGLLRNLPCPPFASVPFPARFPHDLTRSCLPGGSRQHLARSIRRAS